MRQRIPKDTDLTTTALVVMIPIFILVLALIVGYMGSQVW